MLTVHAQSDISLCPFWVESGHAPYPFLNSWMASSVIRLGRVVLSTHGFSKKNEAAPEWKSRLVPRRKLLRSLT